MRFEFATTTRIIFGAGTLRDIGAVAKQFGCCALLVTGRDSRRAEPLVALLREQAIITVPFSLFGEPEVATIQQAITLGRTRKCDLVISLGGGSALDAGKAIAAMLTNPGELLDYLEVIGRGKSLTQPSAPFIAIPTTAGTGSEVTRNAVLASAEHRVKVSLRSPLMLPRLALIDPELTYSLPPAITARTGLDALTQLIEPYVCARANPMTDALCIEGIGRVGRSLRAAFREGGNITARQDMAVASLFGGLALANAGLGAVHGFAGPIGGMFPAPHGAICAALLPHVMRANVNALRQRQPGSETLARYDHLAQLLSGKPGAKTDAGIESVKTLLADLRIPGLATYGVTRDHKAELVEKGAQASSMKTNPIALTREELGEVLEHAL